MDAQNTSENVPDPTNNNSNIKRVPFSYEQTNSIILWKFSMICRVELLS